MWKPNTVARSEGSNSVAALMNLKRTVKLVRKGNKCQVLSACSRVEEIHARVPAMQSNSLTF
ncbi:unnamed protein product [Chrysoparadoxa australica]